MSDKSQVMFKKIQEDEKARKLSMLAQNKAEVIIWEKGQKSRHHFNASYFDKLKMSILVDNISEEDYDFKNPLISFEMSGVAYFGKVKFEKVKEGYFVKCTQDLFKSERRSNFRILTYPAHSFYIFFDVEESYPGSNVVDIHTRIRQTDLFKNFLKLVDDNEDINESTLVYRINDLSVTGLSFNIGTNEKDYFDIKKIYKNIKVHLNDEVLIIPEVEIRYQQEVNSKFDKNVKEYKIGAMFIDLPTSVDNLLGSKINSILREFEDRHAFEDFLE